MRSALPTGKTARSDPSLRCSALNSNRDTSHQSLCSHRTSFYQCTSTFEHHCNCGFRFQTRAFCRFLTPVHRKHSRPDAAHRRSNRHWHTFGIRRSSAGWPREYTNSHLWPRCRLALTQAALVQRSRFRFKARGQRAALACPWRHMKPRPIESFE